jgi:hypothetical protein
MKERDFGSYIEDLVEHMSYAEEFVKDLTFEDFANQGFHSLIQSTLSKSRSFDARIFISFCFITAK